MKALRRFVALSGSERLLVLRAAVTVGSVRLGLWLLPPAALLRRVEKSVERRRKRRSATALPVARVAWSVRAVSRRVPGATCLVQALAARMVLAQYGHDADLRIGVRRGDDGAFEAHAWAEVNGRSVIGGRDVGRYSRLPNVLDALQTRYSRGAT